MAKYLPPGLRLDAEVAALVTRIGATGKPESYMTAYSIDRIQGDITKVTIAFIADEEFSKMQIDKEETKNG